MIIEGPDEMPYDTWVPLIRVSDGSRMTIKMKMKTHTSPVDCGMTFRGAKIKKTNNV